MLKSNDLYLLDYLNILSQDLDSPQATQDRAEKRVVIEQMKTEIFAQALPKG